MTRKIQTLNAISKKGLCRLPAGYEVSNDGTAPDAILVRSQVMHELPIPASVMAIGRAGAGTNNIPIKAMSERGVVVFNAPGANSNAVKELVLAGMLMGTRNIFPPVWKAMTRRCTSKSKPAKRTSSATNCAVQRWASSASAPLVPASPNRLWHSA